MSLVTTNQAVKDLFGIEGSEPLRSKANSYLRNGVIPSSLVIDDGFSDESMGKRGKKLLKSQAVHCLFNALVLDAFFNDTKFVKAIFEQSRTRVASVALCEEVLLKAQAVATVSHLSNLAQQFLSQLKDESFNLREYRLTCPFDDQRLPQMDMALQNTGLLYQLLRAQRLSLSHKEQIWLCWLEQDLAAASQLADQVDSALLETDMALKEMVKRAHKEYQEAQSFNALLSSLPD
ncbi:hypothetical protein GNP79_08150 [Aliivibrio fischeri]|uniref:Uncharacterized protein n=1 Tax=Aliivibrio fischeri TaxID=668 RepID=A0A6N3Z3J7_ALIFS|nr:hypothetical protein [Aliivibrio fischeri]MUK45120.1 hypothetical protein [Aliivibrio fischeri]MUK80779.1 hypothetical protein [Aliivibrio fischeri]MUK84212.1 hypothetical protein [Aliivibrio fischeri]